MKVETALNRESTAQLDIDTRSGRMWRVVNPESRDSLGNRAGYME